MSMVERVARAICWKNGMNPDLTLGGDGVNFLWHEYEGQARAAIEAMREPSGKMVSHLVVNNNWESMPNAPYRQFIDPVAAYKIMIDAALNEGKE